MFLSFVCCCKYFFRISLKSAGLFHWICPHVWHSGVVVYFYFSWVKWSLLATHYSCTEENHSPHLSHYSMGGWPCSKYVTDEITQILIYKSATWCIPRKFKNSFPLFVQSSVNWIMYTGEAVNKLPGFVYGKLFAWCYSLQMSKY